MSDWRKDLSRSAAAFHGIVWPKIAAAVGGGELVPVEAVTATSFSRQLDVLAGIDAWQIKQDAGLRGVASRVQWVEEPWPPFNSFTVRKSRDSGVETEFSKRLLAINRQSGWLFPYLTVQAYLRKADDTLISAGVCKTEQLIRHIEAGGPSVRSRRTGNAEFYYVNWSDYQKVGLQIWTVTDPPSRPVSVCRPQLFAEVSA